jgi:hypothetical protein
MLLSRTLSLAATWIDLVVPYMTGGIYFFISSLITDVYLSNLDYTASKECGIGEWWIVKDVEGRGRGLIK